MHADDDEAVLPIFLIPRPHIGEGSQAIDAAVGPEVDDDDFALELFARKRRAVEPWTQAVERGQLAFDREHQFAHRIGSGAGLAHLLAEPKLARQTGLQAGGLRARQFRKHARVEAQGDRADADEHQHTEHLADAFAGAERFLHSREHLAADQQGEG